MSKRKYVLTEARLKANRANLEKARAAAKGSRSHMTEKKLAACRANLIKARAAPRKGRQPGFRHSIEASLKAAKEKLEDFREHLKKFERLFRPQGEMETRLVRVLAEAAWRRLRVFRAQARWEARELARALGAFGGRAKAGEGTAGNHLLVPSLTRRGAGDGGRPSNTPVRTLRHARDPSPCSGSQHRFRARIGI